MAATASARGPHVPVDLVKRSPAGGFWLERVFERLADWHGSDQAIVAITNAPPPRSIGGSRADRTCRNRALLVPVEAAPPLPATVRPRRFGRLRGLATIA